MTEAEKNFVDNYLKVLEEQGVDCLFRDEYQAVCGEGFSLHHLKVKLKKPYIGLIKLAGGKIKARNKPKTSLIHKPMGGKIYCLRRDGNIPKADCVPDSDLNVCPRCPSIQSENIKILRGA